MRADTTLTGALGAAFKSFMVFQDELYRRVLETCIEVFFYVTVGGSRFIQLPVAK